VSAERAVSRALGGSCSMPLAAHARWVQGKLQLDAAWGDPEGRAPLVRASTAAAVQSHAEAEALGMQVAASLRAAAAVGDGAAQAVPGLPSSAA
jgi:hydroxymethylbilane synthase